MESLYGNKTNNSNHKEFTPNAGIYFLVVAIVTTAIVSIFGNLLVHIAFWRVTSLRKSSSAILVMALATSDFCMAAFIMPLTVMTALHGESPQSHDLCVASGFLNTVLTAIQFGILCSISVNRYIAVTFPHRYQLNWKPTTTYKMLLIVLFHSVLWSIAPFCGWGGYDYIHGTLFCNINWSQHKAHSTSLLVFCYIIPAVVASMLYIAVFLKVRKMRQSQQRKVNKMDSGSGQETGSTLIERNERSFNNGENCRTCENEPSLSPGTRGDIHGSYVSVNSVIRLRKRELQVTSSLLLVATAFAIFWLPRGLVNFIAIVNRRDSIPRAAEYTTTVFIFMSSFINPIIYAFFQRQYKEAFKEILSGMIK
ncbi:melanopsin-B-like [Xenia sp. Carnegie-2017]|uniref:melanopsin-B-like n=1 Tax=Xenia sp. Carnegie-2017 TaxID=2897299 RepID=UPI001F04828F|nr:melanopsin-B-like [Xenia sp. Carnegie-2017]